MTVHDLVAAVENGRTGRKSRRSKARAKNQKQPTGSELRQMAIRRYGTYSAAVAALGAVEFRGDDLAELLREVR